MGHEGRGFTRGRGLAPAKRPPHGPGARLAGGAAALPKPRRCTGAPSPSAWPHWLPHCPHPRLPRSSWLWPSGPRPSLCPRRHAFPHPALSRPGLLSSGPSESGSDPSPTPGRGQQRPQHIAAWSGHLICSSDGQAGRELRRGCDGPTPVLTAEHSVPNAGPWGCCTTSGDSGCDGAAPSNHTAWVPSASGSRRASTGRQPCLRASLGGVTGREGRALI